MTSSMTSLTDEKRDNPIREGRSCRPESRGEWFWPAVKDERVQSGTSRKETVGARRPKPSARISGRVVRASATGECIRSGTSRKETMGARRLELQARISGRVVLASGEGRARSIGYKSEGDGGCAKAGAECKNLGESGSSISDGQAHSIGYKSEPDIDESAAGLGMGRVGRRSRSKGRNTRSRRPIDLGRTWKFASCEVEGRCAKAGAECKNLGESGSSSGDGQAHSIGYKTVSARRPELQARISGRVVLASGEGRARSIAYKSEGDGGCAKAGVEGQNLRESGSGQRQRASAFDRDRDGQLIKGQTCEIASWHGCAVQGSAESKSKADIGASAAGLAKGTVGRAVKANVEITDRDGRSIKSRTCKIADRHRCTEPGSARSESMTDIGANAAGLAVGTVAQRSHETV